AARAGARPGARAGHRGRRRDPARDPRRLRARVDARQRTRPARWRSARGRRAAGAGRGRRSSRRLYLLLEHERARFRLALPRLVLGEAALHDGARQDAHQTPALLDDGNPLEVLLLEEAEGILEPETGVEGEVRRLGDLAEDHGARLQPGGDDLAHERLPGHDADQAPVVLGDEDRADLAALGEAAAGLLRARGCGE